MVNWFDRHRILLLDQEIILNEIQALKKQFIQVERSPRRTEVLYQLMVQYVSRQDSAFYNELRPCYSQDLSKVKIIDFFAHDLNDLRVLLFGFEEKYLTGSLGKIPQGFRTDFNDLTETIALRFKMEQEQFFSLLLAAKENPTHI